MDLLQQRLLNQGLIRPKFKTATEIVKWLGAVQSQDYQNAKWALSLRLPNATNESIENEINSGKIIRTHILRPTWHFVAAEDVRWMLELTAPRIKSNMAQYFHNLSLTEEILAKSASILKKALKRKILTRPEIRQILEKENISTEKYRFGFILLYSELNGLICNGPRKNNQFTYVLLDEFVPKSKSFSPKDPLTELVKRYFTSHGPATIQDFTWWAFLKNSDVKNALEKSGLSNRAINGKNYWFQKTKETKQQKIHLLPNYDEYFSYKDRSDYLTDYKEKLTEKDLYYHFILINGKIVGSWKSRINKGKISLEKKFFVNLTKSQDSEIDRQLQDYLKFFNPEKL